ncbi:soluble pyridine nucleotide transhydrogenase [Pirellulimonas nuda]|uniref:Soluble pyridine nucleotide transhydrogenase n=1 Tax=Pirellulimonas nuda TaxID=2528009 RepID=A0A518DE54_9BACT|nr:FAD-dependent oxidoreductase [Pirellulimonas nuda]QDU89749.1 soluble pyridine nucleotide transhydrogenase [Pirellulimonas nuda]
MRILAALATVLGSLFLAHPAQSQELVLLETEAFPELGGWLVDQQFMDLMGSPYVLAHGLGEPVPDAVTSTTLPRSGVYRVWVRTRDWVAPWSAPGAPGKFQVVLNGQPLETTFGTEGAQWHWQDGGEVQLSKDVRVVLHDLTGFEGRCDAILLAKDTGYIPPDGGEALAKLRSKHLGWDAAPADGGEYDLVVVGGGIAGTSAAITAARLGVRVALIQDRPVLGGNGSSEVRVWPEGKTNHEPYPRIGDVVAELVRDKGPADGNAKDAAVYDDQRKLDLARAEPNLTLMLEQRVNAASVSPEGRILSVVSQDTRSGKRTRVRGRWFLDSTGDAVLGALVGADYEITQTGHLGASNLWNVDAVEKNEHQLQCLCEDDDPLSLNFTPSDEPAPFPRCPWAVDLSSRPFPGRDGDQAKPDLAKLGGWFWESGFDKDPILDMEEVRDQNLRAMYGAWDTLKNVDQKYPTHRLKWAAFVAGKRESRRLLGDVVLSGEDFRQATPYPDACFPCTWKLDLHLADPKFDQGGSDPFISKAEFGPYTGPYWAPYRCLYSRNVGNLFMAGRNISVNHEALGAVRVMRTCGMMGEAVGMAVALCKQHDCTPRDVYQTHLGDLKRLMQRGAGKAATSTPVEAAGLKPQEADDLDARPVP